MPNLRPLMLRVGFTKPFRLAFSTMYLLMQEPRPHADEAFTAHVAPQFPMGVSRSNAAEDAESDVKALQ